METTTDQKQEQAGAFQRKLRIIDALQYEAGLFDPKIFELEELQIPFELQLESMGEIDIESMKDSELSEYNNELKQVNKYLDDLSEVLETMEQKQAELNDAITCILATMSASEVNKYKQ